jgi:hypothetical protein
VFVILVPQFEFNFYFVILKVKNIFQYANLYFNCINNFGFDESIFTLEISLSDFIHLNNNTYLSTQTTDYYYLHKEIGSYE